MTDETRKDEENLDLGEESKKVFEADLTENIENNEAKNVPNADEADVVEDAVEVEEASVEEKKEETYAFHWEYAEQTINDRERARKNQRKREKGVLAYAIIMTVAFLLAFAILICSLSFDNIGAWFDTDTGKTLSTAEIAEKGMPSTVAIFASHGNGGGSMGSGFALTESGYIMTNYHVVANAVSIWVVDTLGNEYSASVVGYDELLDIAVIFAENARFTPVTIGDSDAVAIGEEVLAIGCPNGEELLFSVSNGIISGTNREIDGRAMLQTNAPLNPGNSGGPLFDSKGYVVGVVTSKMTYTTTEAGEKIALEGIAFAVPINAAMALAEDVIAKDLERLMIGVSAFAVTEGEVFFITGDSVNIYGVMVDISGKKWYQDESGNKVQITSDLLEAEGNYLIEAHATGVAIVGVTEGLGADGVLEIGDIVVEVNGVSVASIEEIKSILNSFNPGDKVSVAYYRNGEKRTAAMTLKTKRDMLEAQGY